MAAMRRIHSKDDIVQAGLDIILSKGYNATGVEMILKRANIPKGSFYNFFTSKEEFSLAIIDKYVADRAQVFSPIFSDPSIPPVQRIKKSIETLTEIFEDAECTRGCLIGNLGLEMADHFEHVRQRLEKALLEWTADVTKLLLQAQKEQAISGDIDAGILAENLISSFEGALLRSRIKKSPEPLKNFIHLYFDVFLKNMGGKKSK